MMLGLALWISAALAVVPAGLVLRNLALLGRPAGSRTVGRDRGLVSILIPARNEACNIGPALEAALASTYPSLEVLVLDDASTDATAEIVAATARHDSRVTLLTGAPLARGWRGKVFACQQLARAARGARLVFVDADVRLAPAAIEQLVAALERSGAALVSGIPHQTTVTLAEQLVVPLIHFVLYGYLPIATMRRRRDPAFGAACGQLVAIERSAYEAVGGHASIAGSVHDGIALARRFRRAGFATELLDAETLATCRMYETPAAVLAGFAKNAHEGLGSPRGLVPWTLILGLGQCLPAVAAPWVWDAAWALAPVSIALAAGYGSRIALARRFGHTPTSVALHPLAVALLIAIQWYALARRLLRRPLTWKQRLVLP